MTAKTPSAPSLIGRLSTPSLIVTMFLLGMSACVLGLVVWKAYDARRIALVQSETEIRNLVRSLTEHASHTIQSVDVVVDDLVALLRFRGTPTTVFNDRLREIVDNLPHLRRLAVLDERGDLRFASIAQVPHINYADRSYFNHHRDNPHRELLITGPLLPRTSSQPVIALTRRIETPEGQFAGVVVATIESDYFLEFYKMFKLGTNGSINLINGDGNVLIRWPALSTQVRDLSRGNLFQKRLKDSPTGYHRIVSPFDGLVKYYAYEKSGRYPLIVTVSRSEASVLSGWYEELRSDILVAIALLACIVLLATLLGSQLRYRQRVENILREREARFRLIDANIADVVLLLDNKGVLVFVSQSSKAVLGFTPEQLIGQSCFDLVHPDDASSLRLHNLQLDQPSGSERREFRLVRPDGTMIWLEANFRFTKSERTRRCDIVCTLRDVTQRKRMEDEVEALNFRLAEMAKTDGLTGLPNRRSLDDFINNVFATHADLAVLMIDIDYFKGLNDCLGHQAGDEGLRQIGKLLGDVVANTGGLAARYGGEEFAVILPGSDAKAAMALAETARIKIRDLALANPAAPNQRLTVSIGVASRTAATPDASTLFREADIALYEAKRRSRDCSVAAPVYLGDAGSLVPEVEARSGTPA
ncbi:sensor domain-containing diguanylate cyclase [Rhodopseudomonas pseudopalustris]|uniref:Diguanylate cyclase with PAS/PAC sensor n=1 Tax=Rhodopseudomonas pseudopalustris TaxID=1513892 RepID=A0A1H8QKG1_9BRAD|nr:diguanylate cyclase [Rhodopseudomonas pseudopalustris]SEO54427.1 diguanylate cyclase with PAS/PAC sensor [Rhodopseudomonas pseudopalustris]